MHKTGQSGGFLGRFLGPLSKTGFLLMKNVLKTLAVLILLNAAIQGEILGSGMHLLNVTKQTTLLISNEEMDDIIKVIKSLQVSGLFKKGLSETIQNEPQQQKGGFLAMLLGTLEASLLGILLGGRQVKRLKSSNILERGFMKASESTIRADEITFRAVQDFNLMPSHALTNFEIEKYYKNEPKFNVIYSRNNLAKIKDRAYVINLDEYKSIRAASITLYVNDNNVT